MTNAETDQPWTSFGYAVVDVEGNGQQPPDLVELAIVPITAGNIGQPLAWLVRPPRPITAMATRFHRINNDDIATCPRVEDVADEIRAALGDSIFVAHNAHVDRSVVERHLPGYTPTTVIDTLKLARRLAPGLASYRLGELVTAFKLHQEPAPGHGPHRAAYDALACARLLAHLATPADGSPHALGELLTTATGPPPKRPPVFDNTDALF
jgi:DNA polymerase III epsilon subunit-like protein